MIFGIFITCLLWAVWDSTIEHATNEHRLCTIGWQRVHGWTLDNNAAFCAADDELRPIWDTRERTGEQLSSSFGTFLHTLQENKDWVTGKSPWHKIKYMPAILIAADKATWPDKTEFQRPYPRLGIDFLGMPNATDLKTAIGLQWGDRTPPIFYHDLQLPKDAPQLPEGPWTGGNQIVRYWHNGYSFGGRRLEGEIGSKLDNGPEDCSSFIAKLLGFDPDRSTASTIKTTLEEHGKEVIVKAPEHDIKAGQILFYPGHIALVFGLIEKNKPLVLEYNRDREQKGIEGFGFRQICIAAGTQENTWYLDGTSDRKVQFFD